MAQGFVDLIAEVKDGKNITDIFPKYLEALFPFTKKEQETKDDEMKKMMARQVSKGVLVFNPMDMNFVKKKVKQMSIPDEWAEKLRARAKEKK
jgi:hypothetical protein